MKSQAGGLVEPVHFVVIRRIRTQILIALFHDHVAGGAGAASSAGVFDLHAEIDGDVQNGLGFAMFVVGKLAGLKFDSLPLRQKRNFGHNPIVTRRPLSYWIFHV